MGRLYNLVVGCRFPRVPWMKSRDGDSRDWQADAVKALNLLQRGMGWALLGPATAASSCQNEVNCIAHEWGKGCAALVTLPFISTGEVRQCLKEVVFITTPWGSYFCSQFHAVREGAEKECDLPQFTQLGKDTIRIWPERSSPTASV